jgi:hypothetical protein
MANTVPGSFVSEYFGSISGELQVDPAKFKQAVTMFCLANPEDEES